MIIIKMWKEIIKGRKDEVEENIEKFGMYETGL